MTRFPLLLCMLAGCASGPVSGTWLYGSTEVVSDTCDLIDDIGVPGGDFYVYNEGKGSVVIDPNDGSDVFRCTLAKDDLTCPDRFQDSRSFGATTVTAVVGVEATMDGREAASGSQIATFTCEGPNCAQLEAEVGQPFPCIAEVAFDATWTSPTVP
ncbi:MAG: hypothetical protein R3F61_00930 [Myxococcota bacterium]